MRISKQQIQSRATADWHPKAVEIAPWRILGRPRYLLSLSISHPFGNPFWNGVTSVFLSFFGGRAICKQAHEEPSTGTRSQINNARTARALTRVLQGCKSPYPDPRVENGAPCCRKTSGFRFAWVSFPAPSHFNARGRLSLILHTNTTASMGWSRSI